MITCKWCGKQFNYDSFSRGSRSTEYCCGRCYNAAKQAEREEQLTRQREREDRKQRLAEIEAEGGFLANLLKFWRIIKWTFLIIVGLIIIISIIKGNK